MLENTATSGPGPQASAVVLCLAMIQTQQTPRLFCMKKAGRLGVIFLAERIVIPLMLALAFMTGKFCLAPTASFFLKKRERPVKHWGEELGKISLIP